MKQLKRQSWRLIVWLILMVAAIVTLPNITELTRQHSTIRLPETVQSEVAKTMGDQFGSKKKNTYELGLVFYRKGGLSVADQIAVDNTIKKLKDDEATYGIKDILAPNDNQATKKKLKSKDGTTWVVQVNVSKKAGTIAQVSDKLRAAIKTSGIKSYVTGADLLLNDFSDSIQEGIKKTELITVVFIFIVLVLVFRSPIVPLVSLLTVGISFLVSFGIVTNLVAHYDFPFSNFTQVFIVIVLFGIGTDYNILLYDKFKENLGKDLSVAEAEIDARKKAGKTILYSGSSILIGFTALGLAQFSIYQSAVGVAVGVAVLLIVLLTLNPFFMLIMGKKMFWPAKKFEGETASKLWHGISKFAASRAIISLLLIILVTVPLSAMYKGNLNYDDATEITDSVQSKKGLLIIQKHFSKGMAEPTTLFIRAKHKLDNEKDLKALDELLGRIQSSKEVDFAVGVTRPYGDKVNRLYVNNQLKTVNKGTKKISNGLTKLHKGSVTVNEGTKKLADGSDKLTAGSTKLASGTKELASGLQQLNSQLSSQMSGKSASQIAQLKQGLPQINAGIQKLNKALGQSKVDLSPLESQLTNVAKQATIIGQQTTAAANTLKDFASEDSLKELATQLKLTPAQTQALAKIMASKLSSVSDNLKSIGVADQSIGLSMQQVSDTATTLKGLLAKVTEMKAAVKQLATASNVALPGAATALDQLQSGLLKVQSATESGVAGANRLSSGADTLSSGLGTLNAGARKLAENTPKISTGLSKANNGLQLGQNYLTALEKSAAAKTFYIPKENIKNATFQKSIDAFMSPDKKSVKIIVVYKTDPSGEKARQAASQLTDLAKKPLKGTSLANAKIATGGQSMHIQDTKDVASKDFTRTAIIMIVGISLALMVVTRSFMQPLYIMGILLVSYFGSLSINQWLVKPMLGRSELAWNVPFFSFIMIIALGVDYSIFLMTRYREERMENADETVAESIVRSTAIIGTVVISAVIILGGTFAALIPSGIPTLIEVATTVIIGLLMLLILIPLGLPAAVKLTYK
ncbi:MAG: MMPL family transporter [Lactobacillus sp.]|nr:MMPL family transporter [Lactobacillus sp.]